MYIRQNVRVEDLFATTRLSYKDIYNCLNFFYSYILAGINQFINKKRKYISSSHEKALN
jgi:hypothetical protein